MNVIGVLYGYSLVLYVFITLYRHMDIIIEVVNLPFTTTQINPGSVYAKVMSEQEDKCTGIFILCGINNKQTDSLNTKKTVDHQLNLS